MPEVGGEREDLLVDVLARVAPAHESPHREGVSHVVDSRQRTTVAPPELAAKLPERDVDGRVPERRRPSREKKGVALPATGERSVAEVGIGGQFTGDRRMYGHDAGTARFASHDRQVPEPKVDVIALQPESLPAPQPRRREQTKEGAVRVGGEGAEGLHRHRRVEQGGQFLGRVDVRLSPAVGAPQRTNRRHLVPRIRCGQILDEATHGVEPPGAVLRSRMWREPSPAHGNLRRQGPDVAC